MYSIEAIACWTKSFNLMRMIRCILKNISGLIILKKIKSNSTWTFISYLLGALIQSFYVWIYLKWFCVSALTSFSLKQFAFLEFLCNLFLFFRYSFAIVGINLTHMAYKLLKESALKSHLFNFNEGRPTLDNFHHFYRYYLI